MCIATASCNCKSVDHIDEFYDICRECHRLIDLQFSAPLPTKSTKLTYPNSADSAVIRAQIVADWIDIADMRKLGVGWLTILKTKGYTFGVATLGKHYRAVIAERTGVTTTKRPQGHNPGVNKRKFRQADILFGVRA